MTELKVGDIAPAFTAEDHLGNTFSLSDLKGKRVILYFYPKDNTPGCTAEACNLQDNYHMWLSKGYEVVGVSPDSAKSHAKFAEKYNLQFKLIPDTDKSIMKRYGAYGPKTMYGKLLDGVLRTTFVINEEGIIEQVFKKVDTKDHTNQILKTVE